MRVSVVIVILLTCGNALRLKDSQSNLILSDVRRAYELHLKGIDHADTHECGTEDFKQPELEQPVFGGVRASLGTEGSSAQKIIVDIGGNLGEDVGAYLSKFPNAKIFVYEPVAEFNLPLAAKYAGNPNVQIGSFGAANEDRVATFNLDGVATSGLDSTGKGRREDVTLKDIDNILQDVTMKAGHPPDALSVNCEGCEYEVMQRVADRGWLDKIPFVQLSWHVVDGVMNRKEKRCAFEKKMSELFEPAFWTHFGWTGWKHKNADAGVKAYGY